jgi:hypothetical protein
MIDLSTFFAVPPFAWGHAEKASRLLEALKGLRAHHEAACPQYRRLSHLLGGRAEPASVEAFPFLPVRLFKMRVLRSIGPEQVLKTMTSSGTTGQALSKIVLDKETAMMQTRAFAHIMKDVIGNKRLPMVIIDSKSVLKDRKTSSARAAGILGFSNFGYDHLYVLKDDMDLDSEGLLVHLEKHCNEPILFFGFTFMIWQHFCETLERRAICLDLDEALVVHGGGWKKLDERSVSNEVFKDRLKTVCGRSTRVHNFYGMVEQTGSVYVECEHGHLHASNFSQVVIRDPISFEPVAGGRRGVIETMSVLPWSYPGHALLTEDIGEMLGEDDCACGRKGRYFAVHGRLPEAELRGCSDTYALDQ